jgi:hypothetical protein
MGESLPHALATLLRGREGALAIGCFPSVQRAGTATFWEQVRLIGLQVELQRVDGDDPRWGRLYVFRLPPAGARNDSAIRSTWGVEDDDEEARECNLTSLFDDFEDGSCL